MGRGEGSGVGRDSLEGGFFPPTSFLFLCSTHSFQSRKKCHIFCIMPLSPIPTPTPLKSMMGKQNFPLGCLDPYFIFFPVYVLSLHKWPFPLPPPQSRNSAWPNKTRSESMGSIAACSSSVLWKRAHGHLSPAVCLSG